MVFSELWRLNALRSRKHMLHFSKFCMLTVCNSLRVYCILVSIEITKFKSLYKAETCFLLHDRLNVTFVQS